MTEAAVAWAFVPWRDRPALAGRAALAAVVMVLVIAALAEALMLRVVLGVVVAFSIGTACLPVRCRLGPEGASLATPLGTATRPWTAIRRAVVTGRGVQLSPFAGGHWLEPFRYLQLPLPARDRDGLAGRVRSVLAAHGF